MFRRRGVIFCLLFLAVFLAFGQHGVVDNLVVPDVVKLLDVEGFRTTLDSFPESAKQGYLEQFILPGSDGYIISRFGPRSGRMHYGTDIKMYKGDTVVATQSGVIARANWGYGFGRLVIIQHRNNIQTYYAHLTKFLKNKGDKVEKGEPIGLAGSTGRARGPHLHFEMRENGQPFDPELVFDFKEEKYVRRLMKRGFEKFFKYRILPYDITKETPIYFIGSIAFYFREILDSVAAKHDLKITGVIQRPIDNLIEYHKNHISL